MLLAVGPGIVDERIEPQLRAIQTTYAGLAQNAERLKDRFD